MMPATIQSRKNPAAISPQRGNRAAFGPFCDAVRRLACLTPTQKDVACLLAEATLLQGVTSLPFESLDLLTAMGHGLPPFAGLGKNDLSLAISGGMARGERLQQGLKHFGIVVLDERGPLERGLRCTILTVIADSAQWGVPPDAWRYSAADKVQWLANVAACRRAFTAQLEGLVCEADLLDARAAVAAESVATQVGNALEIERPITTGACRAVVSAVNALEVRPERTRGVPLPCRSDSRNAKTPEKARRVPTFGTPSRARASVQVGQGVGQEIRYKTGQNNPNWMDSFKREELKLKIGGDEREFRFAATAIIGSNDWDDRSIGHAPNGVRWMNRWLAGGAHRSKAVAVFAQMLQSDFIITTTSARAAQNLWKQFGGESLDADRLAKKSKESFI